MLRIDISRQDAEKLSLKEIRRFVEASEAIRFAGGAPPAGHGDVPLVAIQEGVLQEAHPTLRPDKPRKMLASTSGGSKLGLGEKAR